MNTKDNLELIEDDNFDQNSIHIRDIIDKYLRYWKWFIFSLIISISLVFLKLNFSRLEYEATSTIKIKDENGGDNSTLSVFQDLNIMGGSKENVEDEIEILKSKSLISEVVKALNLNIVYFTEKNKLSDFLDSDLGMSTEFFKTENYIKPPIKINFFISDSLLHTTKSKFIISIKSSTNYTFFDIEGDKISKHSFGEKISTNFGDIVITPNEDLKGKDLVNQDILVNISSIKSLVTRYSKKLIIEPKSEFSNVLNLTLTDGVKRKAEDFLNTLVEKYNDRAIAIKENLSKSTSDFVDKRLLIISEDLSNVDLSAESIKTRYRITDAASEAGLNMESGRIIENQIVQANTELEKINFIKDFVATKDQNEVIPFDLGTQDDGLSSSVQQYNTLMREKKRFLKTSTEKNPIVVNINEQLQALDNTIKQGLDNMESTQRISLDALTTQGNRINSKLYAAPKQERQVRDIQRQQQIKEALYLYLLQKREETAITLGVSDPNAEIIDYAESKANPIAPNKKVLLFIGAILGLIVPFVSIYAADLLDSKVHTKEDVEKVLNIPIIGDIPKFKSKTKYLIKKDDYSSVAEAFRILRTNLSFVTTNSDDTNGKTIFVTSTIAHEGKSFITSNLASALAHAGKKTLILGMDIRAPRIKHYLGVRGKKGITNYIIDQEITPEQITTEVPSVENLYIMSSGDIAPNPAELLMNVRVKELFEYAKKNYDYVIVDTAAYSMVTDTLILSKYADVVIYTIRANFLDKRALRYIKSLYHEKRLPNLALLVNDIDHKKSNRYGYGYGYGYGSKFDNSKDKPWWKFKS